MAKRAEKPKKKKKIYLWNSSNPSWIRNSSPLPRLFEESTPFLEKMFILPLIKIFVNIHEYNHSASNNNPIPIHFERKGLNLDLLDSTEIKLALSNNSNILNNQLEVNKNTIID